MKSVEKSARTYEEALNEALKELDASINDVEVLTLEEGSKGLFGLFGSRPTKIRVTLKQEEEDEDLLSILHPVKKPEQVQRAVKPVEVVKETPKAREPKAEKPAKAPAVKVEASSQEATETVEPVAEAVEADVKPVQEAAVAEKKTAPARQRKPRNRGPKPTADAEKIVTEEKKPLPPKAPVKPLEKPVVTMIPAEEVVADSAAGKARDFLKELTNLMGVDVEIAMGTDAEGNVFAQMTGDTLGVLIGRRGETLDALQYLTSLKVNRGQEGYTRVTLDTENYRAKREDTLIRLANRMANRAVKTGRKVSLEPMNPYERRIIHSALQNNEAVDTHSEGEEPNRYVVITLRKA